MSRVVIIGAGASGLMAAIWAARGGASVTVLEHNDRPGRKLLASGNGKCNLTNLAVGIEKYHCDSPEFVRHCLEMFSVSDTMNFFKSLGLQLHSRDGWIYPVTDQASSVLQILLMEAQYLHVKLKTQEEVIGVEKLPDGTFQVQTSGWKYAADRVILSCGSPASAVKGSSDTAQKIGNALGLSTVPFLPSLVPLKIREPFSSKWGGCRVHARVNLFVDGKERNADCGEIQLTEHGISGIPVFQISHDAVIALDQQKKVTAVLNFWPEDGEEKLAALLEWIHKTSLWKTEEQILTGLIPDRLIPVLIRRFRETNGTRLQELAAVICQFPVTVTGSGGCRQAQVCSGGISPDELTPDLMCRKVPGLYVTGEALNVDGLCGGNNLQFCWSTGYLAGTACLERL